MAKASNKDGLYFPLLVGSWYGAQTIDSLKIAGTVLDLYRGYQECKDDKKNFEPHYAFCYQNWCGKIALSQFKAWVQATVECGRFGPYGSLDRRATIIELLYQRSFQLNQSTRIHFPGNFGCLNNVTSQQTKRASRKNNGLRSAYERGE